MTVALVHPSLPTRTWRPGLATVLLVGLTLIVAVSVLAPVAMLIHASLATKAGPYALDHWQQALANPALMEAVKNTVTLTLVHQAISLPIAVALSWLLGRTDLPGRDWLEFGFWAAFFLPSLGVLQGWILLLAPQYGLINTATAALLGLKQGPFDIYSWWGIVFAHLATTAVAAKVMLMTPIFRNMDASLEEAAWMSGDSPATALWKLVVPIMAPVIAVTTVMGLIRALETFEIELVLGGPSRLYVYSTLIYREMRSYSPDYATASTLGLLIMPMMALLALVPHWITRGKSYTTIAGRGRAHLVRLGAWRWPAFAATLLIVALLTFVPIALLCMGSVMSLFGYFDVTPAFSFEHWQAVLTDSLFTHSLRNTLVLALGTAIFTVITSLVVAYAIARTRFWGRPLLDFLSWVPFTMPGILFSLSILWLVLETPLLRPLYGTTSLLIVTIGVASLTLGTQLIKSNLIQISPELEHASWIAGRSWLTTLVRIILPLSTRTILVVGITGFIAAARNVSHLALLASSDNRPLALVQLEYMVEGRLEAASVVGIVVTAMTVGVALAARQLGLRLQPQAG